MIPVLMTVVLALGPVGSAPETEQASPPKPRAMRFRQMTFDQAAEGLLIRSLPLRVAFPEQHNPICILEGKWAQQGSVDGAKDGRVGSDAQGQRQHRDQSEAPVFAKHARAETKIGDEIFYPPHATRIARRFFDFLE